MCQRLCPRSLVRWSDEGAGSRHPKKSHFRRRNGRPPLNHKRQVGASRGRRLGSCPSRAASMPSRRAGGKVCAEMQADQLRICSPRFSRQAMSQWLGAERNDGSEADKACVFAST